MKRDATLPFSFLFLSTSTWASLMAQIVKNPPSMQDTWVRSLGWEDALQEGMANHSRILAWRIPWTAEPGELQSMGSQSQTQTQLSDWAHLSTSSQQLTQSIKLFHLPFFLSICKASCDTSFSESSPHSVGGPPLSFWGTSSGRTRPLWKMWDPAPGGLPLKF